MPQRYLYNATTDLFTETANPIRIGPAQAACGTATLPDGSRVAIVAGGFDLITFSTIATTRMYNVDQGFWMAGPDLPRPLRLSATVSTAEGSFLLFGGADNEYYYDTIIEFDPLNVGWVVREETMTRNTSRAFVVEVHREAFCLVPEKKSCSVNNLSLKLNSEKPPERINQ